MAKNQHDMQIDLRDVRGAQALPLPNQLFSDEMDRALDLVADHVKRVDERVRSASHFPAEAEWEDPQLYHEGILISGGRGSGKTTFILSLAKAIRDDRRRTADIVPLPVLDPTLIDGDSIFIAAIIASILRRVEPQWRKNVSTSEGRRLEDSLNHLSEGLLAANNEVWADHLKRSPSSGIFAERLVAFARGGLQLRRHFGDFVDAAAAILDTKAFLLLVDDVDMAGTLAFPVLETIRRYVTGPRLLPIITGDLGHFSRTVMEYRLRESEHTLRLPNSAGFTQAETVQDLRDMTAQYLLKLIRPERRIELHSAKAALRRRDPHRVEVKWESESPHPFGGSAANRPKTNEESETTSLHDLLHPYVRFTDGTARATADVTDVLPDNARVLRAMLAWATETFTRVASAGPRSYGWLPDHFDRLLAIDPESALKLGWSRQLQERLNLGRYQQLLCWALASPMDQRLRFQSPNPPLTWANVLVARAQAGALAVRFGQLGPGEALRFYLRVAIPAAVELSRRSQPLAAPTSGNDQSSSANARTPLTDLSDDASTGECIARVAAARWRNAAGSVQPGLLRLATSAGIKRDPGQHPVIQRVQSLSSKPNDIGLWPWFIFITKHGGTLNNLYTNTRAPGGQSATIRDGLRLKVTEGGYLLPGELRELLAGLNASGNAPRRGTALLLLRLCQSRVRVSFGDSRLLDPLSLLSVVSDFLLTIQTSPATDNGLLPERVASMLRNAAVLNNADRLTPTNNENDTPETRDPDEDESAAQDDENSIDVCDKLVAEMIRWHQRVHELSTERHSSATQNATPLVRPALAFELARRTVRVQEAFAKDWRPRLPTVGTMLGAFVISFLNDLLLVEARANGITTELESESTRSYLQLAKSPPDPVDTHAKPVMELPGHHRFVANLRLVFDRPSGTSSVNAPTIRDLPLFATLASCPLVLLAVSSLWRAELKSRLGDTYPQNLFDARETYLIPLYPGVENGSQPPLNEVRHDPEIDIADLLHSIPSVPILDKSEAGTRPPAPRTREAHATGPAERPMTADWFNRANTARNVSMAGSTQQDIEAWRSLINDARLKRDLRENRMEQLSSLVEKSLRDGQRFFVAADAVKCLYGNDSGVHFRDMHKSFPTEISRKVVETIRTLLERWLNDPDKTVKTNCTALVSLINDLRSNDIPF